MRKLQTEIPTLEQLGLPPIFKEMIKEKNGIIFVTGATGSGKTTTLAAMLNELNMTQKIHILTLEDPIEFLHPHKQALFNQRQLGKDFPDFASGLRAALRQAPESHSGGRNSRPRHDGNRDDRFRNRSHRLHDDAYDQRGPDDQPRPRNVQQRRGAAASAATRGYHSLCGQPAARQQGRRRPPARSEIMGSSLRTRETLALR